jgi:hypothetical protein
MSARTFSDRFTVSLSYAGEQHDIVCLLAEALEARLGRSQVLFDKWYEHALGGSGADAKLQRIYEKGSRLAVVCVSGDYGRKAWTQTELLAIRARELNARQLAPGPAREAALLSVLELRVGDGDVDVVLSNTITIDVRKKGVPAVAQLICDRLELIDTYEAQAAATPAAAPPPTDPWPDGPLSVMWPLADHVRVLEVFGAMVRRGAKQRLLLLRGDFGLGKSWLLQSMYQNALTWDGVRVGLLDAKGTADIGPALAAWAQDLGVGLPQTGAVLAPVLSSVVDQLRAAAQPTLLLIDTFDQAPPDVQQWVLTQLLPGLLRSPWLRVVVAGVQVPNPQSAVWSMLCGPVQQLSRPTPDDWHKWCQERLNKNLPLAEIEVLCRYITSPGRLAEALSSASAS